MFFGARKFLFDFAFRIEMEPGFVMKRVVADLVTGGRNLAQCFVILTKLCILPDDKESDR